MCSEGKQMSPSNLSIRSSCVKLYLCSNPADSVVERKALRESVFPKLREHCRHTSGLDIRVIDPYESSDPSHWPDETTREQLIEECRESSAGPFLLALIGHEYGRSSLPAQVEVTEYQLLLQESQQAGICTQELERVYQRDENTTPPSYWLKPPHTHTCCTQGEGKEEEESKMKEEELMKVFQTAVSLCAQKGLLTPEKARRYTRSALDADLRFALDNRPQNDIIKRCFVYVHKVANAKSERETRQMSLKLQPKSSTSDQAPVSESELLSDMCDNFLRGLITSCQLQVYVTTTECDLRHGYTPARRRGYAQPLCQQVYSDLAGSIDGLDNSQNTGDSNLSDALAREQAEQEELCAIMSRLYDVTRREEEQIRAYVEQSDNRCPLVVTGGPCAGKTVLLAHCAQKMKSWLQHNDHVVITYFSNFSSHPTPRHLLSSLCFQIARSYDSNSSPSQEDIANCTLSANCNLLAVPRPELRAIINSDISLSDVTSCLSSLLSFLPSSKQSLVLILDGMDQIGKNFAVQIINSLPSPLPPRVKLILTASSNHTQLIQAIKQHYPQCSSPPRVSEGSQNETGYVCVSLGLADRKQCVKMLTSLLSNSGRTVTSGQQMLVNQALTSCRLTLYARLLHVHTSMWHSDSDVSEASLPNSIHSSISALLDLLEEKHTSCLVARAVSYLTLSEAGLTEAELADLVSCDGNIMAEHVQQVWRPSSAVRVPQVDVERLLLDLKSFVIRRTVAGSQVLFWVSRHFKLVVAKRYLDKEARREIHSEMFDYFSGRRARVSTKPVLVKQKALVFKSPFQDAVNVRRVREMVHHLRESDMLQMERGLLMSFRLHMDIVRAGLLWDLVPLLQREEDSSTFTFSRVGALLASTLKSSACLLQSSPRELPSVMETSLFPYLEVFPALKGYLSEIRQERGRGLGVVVSPAPSTVPSIHCLHCDAGDVSVTEAAGTKCGIIAEVTDDGSTWMWKGSGCDLVRLSLSCEQKEVKFVGVRSSDRLLLLSTQCNKLFLWDVTGPEMFLEIKDPLKTESHKHTSDRIAGFDACQKKFSVCWRGERFVSLFDTSSETWTHFQCQGCVTCVEFSSDGSYMYCGQEEGTVSVFDTDSRGPLSTCSNSNHSAVASIILCEDRQEMACVYRSGDLTLWNVAATKQSPRLVKGFAAGKSNHILNTDYSEEVNTLLVCQSNQVSLWDACDWELCDQFLAPQGGTFIQAVLSQDGHLFLALLDTCPLVFVWKVSTGVCVLSLDTNKQPFKLLKRASDIICVTDDGCLLVWDSEMIYAAGAAPKMECGVKEVVVEPSGQWFYTSDGSNTVWRWSIETGLPQDKFLHDNPVEKVRLSLDNTHLVVLSDGEMYVWCTETGQNILRISGSRATDILITPNSNFCVSISQQRHSRVWKLANGSVVCSIHLYLSDAQVSPESTFLIGCHRGDLLAASLWSGTISKRFPRAENSEHVVAFHTLSEHPDFVVVMGASGGVYTWKLSEETVCKHFQLPATFYCQPQDFQMSSDGSYALLSTDNEAITFLDLSEVRLCSFKAEASVMKACLDKTGCYAAYISLPNSLDRGCACHQHDKPVLTVVRLSDGERVESVSLSKNPLTLVLRDQEWVFVGFEDGSVGVYSISDAMLTGEGLVREPMKGQLKECPLDKLPVRRLPLTVPNMTWS